MNKKAIERFAREFKDALEQNGIEALLRIEWADGFLQLGFQMDCGNSYQKRYGFKLGDAESANADLAQVDDILVLGNAIFSQCRYLTHWAFDIVEEDKIWLIAALSRLEELAQPSSRTSMIVTYRFADAVEQAVLDFYERALPGEPLPALVEYTVTEERALDAFIDEIRCTIPRLEGDISLGFNVVQNAWRCSGEAMERVAPRVQGIRAERLADDEETSDKINLIWNDDRNAWEPSKNND